MSRSVPWSLRYGRTQRSQAARNGTLVVFVDYRRDAGYILHSRRAARIQWISKRALEGGGGAGRFPAGADSTGAVADRAEGGVAVDASLGSRPPPGPRELVDPGIRTP